MGRRRGIWMVLVGWACGGDEANPGVPPSDLPCAELACASLNRGCVETDGRGACTDCLPGFTPGFGGVCDPSGAGPASGFGECGTALVDEAPVRVNVQGTYRQPVVLAPSLTFRGSDPAHTRVVSVDAQGFEVRVEEWAYLDGNHALEQVDFVVVDAGVGFWSEGLRYEAGSTTVGGEPVEVRFSQALSRPRLFANEVTANGSIPVVVRVSDLEEDGFFVRLQTEEAIEDPPETETVHWLAVEAGDRGFRSDDPWLVGRESDVDDNPVGLEQRLASLQLPNPAGFLAFMTSTNGGDPAVVRVLDEEELSIFVEEETSSDSETQHAAEQVDWLACPRRGAFSDSD